MSHVQLESAAQHEVVLAVPAHLENGENSEATVCFAVNFGFNDHGNGLEIADPRRLADYFKKIRTLTRLLATDRQSACEWRVRDHPMDASRSLNRAFLRRTFTKDPDLAARRVDPTHRRRRNQGVVGLLPSTEVAAQRFVGLLHAMDRSLIKWGIWVLFLQRLLFQ
jgi:hypothetical protein